MNKLNLAILCVQDFGHIEFNNFSKHFEHFQIFKFSFGLNSCETLAFFISTALCVQFNIQSPKNSKDGKCSLLTISIDSEVLNILNTYTPPSQNRSNYFSSLSEFLKNQKINAQNTIICGDLNDYCDFFLDRWSNYQPSSNSQRGDIISKFKEKGFQDIFRVLNPNTRSFTRFGYEKDLNNNIKKIVATRLDYFLTGKQLMNKVNDINIFEEQILQTDHRLVVLTLSSNLNMCKIPTQNIFSPFLRSFPDNKNKKYWKKEFGESVMQQFEAQNIFEISKNLDSNDKIDQLAEKFSLALFDAVSATLTWKSETSEFQPKKSILNNKLYGKLKQARNLCRKINFSVFKILQSDENNQEQIEKVSLNLKKLNEKLEFLQITPISEESEWTLVAFLLNKCIQKITKTMTKLKKKCKNEQIHQKVSQIIKNIDDDPDFVFKILNKKSKQQLKTIIHTDKTTKQLSVISNPTDVKKSVQENWQKIFDQKDENVQWQNWTENLPTISDSHHFELNCDWKPDDVLSAIKSRKSKSAPGPDSISNKMLKYMSTASEEPLLIFTKLLNAVKNLHYVPKCWKQSYTRLIYKNNNMPYSEDGYRPISLLSVSYKIYSFLINFFIFFFILVVAPNMIPFRDTLGWTGFNNNKYQS